MKRSDHELPHDLEETAERLKRERPEASPLELDRVKLRAITADARRSQRPGLGVSGARRLVPLAVVLGLMAGGTAVFASSGGNVFKAGASHKSAAKTQYCDDDQGDDDQGDDEHGDRKHRSGDESDRRSSEDSDHRSGERSDRKKPKDECDEDDDEGDDDQDEGDDHHRSNHRHHESSSDRVRHKRSDD